jgi:Tfp pilus assembly protein PilF
MKYLSVLVLLLLHVSLSVAANLSLQEPALSKFRDAVALLDNYRGNTSSLEAARAGLSDVLKVDPRYAPAHREMARYFIMRGHISSLNFRPGTLEAADSSIKRAIDINPAYAEAYVLRGHLYRLMGRHQDAVDALSTAERFGTADPWLQNNWADVLIDEGKYEEAAKRYQTVIDSRTQNKKALVSAFEGLIKYYTSVGKLDKADEVYRRQIELEPDAAWGYGNYAQFLLCQRDDYDNSIVRSRQALNIMDYGVGRFWLAAGLYRKWARDVIAGAPESAKSYFSEAQTIYPDTDKIVSYADSCPPLAKIWNALGMVKSGANSTLQGTPARGRP